MPRKPNYNFEKHRKEIAKQKKKAEKRQRKADKKAGLLPAEESGDASGEASEQGDQPPTTEQPE